MDPSKLVPASYLPYVVSVLFTVLTGLAGIVVRKLLQVAADELKDSEGGARQAQ